MKNIFKKLFKKEYGIPVSTPLPMPAVKPPKPKVSNSIRFECEKCGNDIVIIGIDRK